MNNCKDIKIGDKFNSLTVISEAFKEKSGNTSRFYFNVKCDCNTEFKTSATRLRIKSTVKCINCAMRDRSNNLKPISQISQLYNHRIIQRCKKDNIYYNITIEEFENIITKNCHYCNTEPKELSLFKKLKYINTNKLKANGIDRKDNDQGYILNNCIPCCYICNRMKMDLSYDAFLEHINKIKRHE